MNLKNAIYLTSRAESDSDLMIRFVFSPLMRTLQTARIDYLQAWCVIVVLTCDSGRRVGRLVVRLYRTRVLHLNRLGTTDTGVARTSAGGGGGVG